jgi:hypothetical protein
MAWNFNDDAWLRGALEKSGYKCLSLLDNLKPKVDLTKPLPEIDMFCSISLSEHDFTDKDRMLSCQDTAI